MASARFGPARDRTILNQPAQLVLAVDEAAGP
jgi:hypothetical protein